MIIPRKIGFIALLLTAFALLWLPSTFGQETQSSASAQKQYNFAHGLLSREFYDLAAKELREFLQTYPDHELAPRAALDLVRCLRAQDDTDAAMKAVDAMVKRWPKDALTARAILIKGDILFRNEIYEKAAETFYTLATSDDTRIRETALYFLAESYVKMDKTNAALAFFGKLASEEFNEEHVYRPYAAFVLASAYEQQDNIDKATALYERLSQENRGVPSHLREESIYRRAEIAFFRQQYEQAIQLYDRLVKDYPKGRFAKEAEKRRIWAYLSLQQYNTAVQLAEEWRQTYGDIQDDELDYAYASSLLGLERFAAAETLFARIARAEQASENYRRLAAYQQVYCLLRTDRFDAALEQGLSFLKQYSGAPETADTAYFAGSAAAQLEQHDQAVELLEKALATYTGDWQYEQRARLTLAQTLRESGQLAKAAAVYRNLAESEKGADKIQFLLEAAELIEAKDQGEAAKLYTQAMQTSKDPELVRTAAIKLARIHLAGKAFDKAAQTLESLLATKDLKDPTPVRLLAGYAHLQQGNLEDAEKALRQALETSSPRRITAAVQYYLVATLIRQDRTDEALELFAEVLAYPPELRPALSPELLLDIERVYFNRHNYELSERIARLLAASEDPPLAFEASLRLARTLIATNRLQDARTLLEKMRQADEGVAAAQTTAEEQVLSLLGEVYLQLGLSDRAVRAFEKALAADNLSMHDQTRAHWGLAEIYRAEGRTEAALRHAITAFVAGNDPTYTPRAMLIAVRVLLAQGKQKEAAQTWQELKKRYPVYAEQNRQLDVIQTLETAGTEEMPDEKDN